MHSGDISSTVSSLASNARDVVNVGILLLLPAADAVRSEPVLLTILTSGQRPGNSSIFGNLLPLARHSGKVGTDRHHDGCAVGRRRIENGELGWREPLWAKVGTKRDERNDDEREAWCT